MIGVSILIAIVAAAVSWAAIPAPNGVIHSCYSSNGTLRVIDSNRSCRPSERRLLWNQRGAQGLRGPAGPTDVYAAEHRGDDFTLPSTENYEKLIELNVPAGSFVVIAKAFLANLATSGGRISFRVACLGLGGCSTARATSSARLGHREVAVT